MEQNNLLLVSIYFFHLFFIFHKEDIEALHHFNIQDIYSYMDKCFQILIFHI